jgi:hypothetical protein
MRKNKPLSGVGTAVVTGWLVGARVAAAAVRFGAAWPGLGVAGMAGPGCGVGGSGGSGGVVGAGSGVFGGGFFGGGGCPPVDVAVGGVPIGGVVGVAVGGVPGGVVGAVVGGVPGGDVGAVVGGGDVGDWEPISTRI